MTNQNDIVLWGCNPKPLASYLKALGIFRLLTEQFDSETLCSWNNISFVIHSHYRFDDIAQFLLTQYRPTPIISPWSGRAGFLEGENAENSNRKGPQIIATVANSEGVRFKPYRDILIQIGQTEVIQRLNSTRSMIKRLEKNKQKEKSSFSHNDDMELRRSKSEEKTLKKQLLISLRAEMSDEYLSWLDACIALGSNESFSTPLLGTGGNEGSMDYSINHLSDLTGLIDPDSDTPSERAISDLDSALLGTPQALATHTNPGFLNPNTVGGANMGQGYSGFTGDNAWNTVLMLEGVMFFAVAATKRLETGNNAKPSFPFVVDALLAGHGGIADGESTRPEFWAPLWERPITLGELKAVLGEGRATLKSRSVKNGLDMVSAVNTLGINRGLTGFQRFGFFERRGKGYYVATPLSKVQATMNRSASWINDMEEDNWLSKFRTYSNKKSSPKRFSSLCRKLDDALFVIAQCNSTSQVQSIFTILGEIQESLSILTAKTRKEAGLQPIPILSAKWIEHPDNYNSPAFRIALALAGLRGSTQTPLPLRAQWYPVHPRTNDWIENTCKSAHKDPFCQVRLHTLKKGEFPGTLIALLERRLWLGERLRSAQSESTDSGSVHASSEKTIQNSKLLGSSASVGLRDWLDFIQDDRMDRDIAALLPGLMLCKIPKIKSNPKDETNAPGAYGLLKLALTPDNQLQELGYPPTNGHMPIPKGLVTRLASSQANCAIETAWRRLRASGLNPVGMLGALPRLSGIDPRRAAASLLIPLNFHANQVLAERLLKKPEPLDDAA